MSELKRLNGVVEELRKEVAKGGAVTQAEIAALKARAGIVGLIGGAIPAVVVLIYVWANAGP